ncbi:MAG: hypothetical protein ACOCYP_08330 [Planctomycetota bacterium]
MPRLFAILVCLLSVGCLREPHSLRSDEAALAVTYAEEVAHGHAGDPYELFRHEASDGLRRIATWATSRRHGDRVLTPPVVLARRAQRWPLLRNALGRGVLGIDAEGLLRLGPGVAADDRRLLERPVREENLDRVTTASILLTRGHLAAGTPRGRQLITLLTDLRIDFARAAGGRLWDGPSASSSPNAATTSTSPPAPGSVPAN